MKEYYGENVRPSLLIHMYQVISLWDVVVLYRYNNLTLGSLFQCASLEKLC